MGSGNSAITTEINDTTEVVNLTNQNLQEIPFLITNNDSIKSLILSRNHIASIPSNLNNLISCVLSLNNYSSIPKNIIESLLSYPILKNLDLSYNHITEIPKELLEIKTLKRLNLSHNQLSILPQIDNDTLSNLDISFNKLTTIPVLFKNLTILNAEHNLFTKIDVSNYITNDISNDVNTLNMSTLSHLTRLTLSRNNISEISKDLIFPDLLIFDVSHNQIRKLPNFQTFSPILRTLDASFNKIEEIPELPDTLTHMYIHNNEINDIENFMNSSLIISDISFNKIEKLLDLPPFMTTLNISHNLIKEINPINGDNITSINFSNNLISNLPFVNLTQLKFSFNRIVKLDKCNIFNRITLLDISGNDIFEIPQEIFEIASLLKIIASFNHISSLPLGISESTVRFIDLSFNPIEEIGEFPKCIEHVILNYCEIKHVPKILSKYYELVELSCIGNDIIFDECLMNLPKSLELLNLSHNRITNINLAILRNLKYLNLSQNRLEAFPVDQLSFPKLIHLDISANPFSNLNFEKLRAPKLKYLNLSYLQLNDEINLGSLNHLRYLNLVNSFIIPIFTHSKLRLCNRSISKYIHFTNFVGMNECQENMIYQNDCDFTQLFAMFSDINDLLLIQKFISNEQNNTNQINLEYGFIKKEMKLSKNEIKFSLFFVYNQKLIGILNNDDILLVINQDNAFTQLSFYQNSYLVLKEDTGKNEFVKLKLNSSIKYILITKVKSFMTISSDIISKVLDRSNSAHDFAHCLQSTITSFNRFTNCSVIVFDVLSYLHNNNLLE
ncbi:leucine-rich repeat-containing protein [Tritrichomonas foetus]|uniref:Leucine-rich repeat-containing protein n=1 Tax=Tritrichomonas foetus TaxID=1144522 RepID=A0A1J4JKT3_9EUKA|nr:leucine-rich repeat-containing protein [Tritrichomonas foetus]|eukprot:OHS98195.1 leucine-rich repeat-containing protein [Tritrichomonas foetus]